MKMSLEYDPKKNKPRAILEPETEQEKADMLILESFTDIVFCCLMDRGEQSDGEQEEVEDDTEG